ncbi:MAG: hypothetical protein J6Y78_11110 [Paludibacteraceae bacterium]|nr:hypothetical protein [Paludibacteraceae bacterium]
MYIEEKLLPNIIMPLVTERTVQKWCDKHHVFIRVDSDLSTYWAGFSNMYAQLKGLSYIEAGSFSYMVSMFMTGMGVSCGTDMYFREEDIELKILRIYDELKENYDDDEILGKELFDKIFQLYKYDIEKYTLKTNSLNFRLSQIDYDRFMNVMGKTKSDKLRSLLDFYYGKE